MNITEKKLDWEQPVDGYQYHIQLESGKSGDAQIIFRYVDEILASVRAVFLARGLCAEDKVVHLNEFYPNGRGLNESKREHMGKGVGTAVLHFLIQKAISEGAKGMYAFSAKESMQAFLTKKQGFEAFGWEKTLHAKVFPAVGNLD